MADFAPPAGPPPPKVPEGWKAQFNEQYREWFYVNIYTKKSQWEKPTEPVYSPPADGAPDGPPPSYQPGQNAPNLSDKKHGGGPQPGEDDAAMAARLQAEENARAGIGGSPMPGGESADYYGQPGASQSPYPGQSSMQSSPPLEQQRGKSGGLLGKILGKGKQTLAAQQSGSHGSHGGFGGFGGGHSSAGYGGYPQQYGYGGHPQQGYGGYAPYGGYGHAVPKKKSGMSAGGAAALGVGGGLLGGMLIADAINDGQEEAYEQGFEDGGGDMGDMGGDF